MQVFFLMKFHGLLMGKIVSRLALALQVHFFFFFLFLKVWVLMAMMSYDMLVYSLVLFLTNIYQI